MKKEDALKKELGARIRRSRRWKDITQKELASFVGSESSSYICEIEKGRHFPSIYGLFMIEKAIGKVWFEPEITPDETTKQEGK